MRFLKALLRAIALVILIAAVAVATVVGAQYYPTVTLVTVVVVCAIGVTALLTWGFYETW